MQNITFSLQIGTIGAELFHENTVSLFNLTVMEFFVFKGFCC